LEGGDLVDAKPILQSKTFWFNALAGGLAATDYIVGSGVLGPKTTAVAVPAMAALNIFLRTLTTGPVSVK
jgi:hypothetical protein